jgi:hypothetical protein
MALSDQFSDDLAIFLNTDDFAREVVYITQAKVVDAVVDYLNDPGQTSRGLATRAQLHIAKPDATIAQMDEIRFDDTTWVVERVDASDNYVSIVTVRCKERLVFK